MNLKKYFPRIIRTSGALAPPDAQAQAKRRLDYVNEAAFSRVWSVRFSRRQALLLLALAVAATAALIYVVMAFTPLRALLPGTLPGDMRARYIETTLRLDSLSRQMQLDARYLADMRAILDGTTDPDSARASHALLPATTDTLLPASEAERAFVNKFESNQRYQLSVLSPIAADGMAFYSPAPGADAQPAADGTSVELRCGRNQGVDAIYRGTVVSAQADAGGLYTVVIQHPNEFVSIYGGLADIFTSRGATPATGARIGVAPETGGAVTFELWHNGVPLDPATYVAF